MEGDPEELVLHREDLHKRLDLNSNTCKSVVGDDDVEGDPEELVLQRQDLHKRMDLNSNTCKSEQETMMWRVTPRSWCSSGRTSTGGWT